MRPYELNSSLNDDAGEWIASHGVNRYRDWDELRYSIRSVEKHAGSFRNNIQILVNAVEGEDGTMSKQRPTWLKDDVEIQSALQVLSQEDFFGAEEAECLPTFNSLTIENQIYNTPSDTDRVSRDVPASANRKAETDHHPDLCNVRSHVPRQTSCSLRHLFATLRNSHGIQA